MFRRELIFGERQEDWYGEEKIWPGIFHGFWHRTYKVELRPSAPARSWLDVLINEQQLAVHELDHPARWAINSKTRAAHQCRDGLPNDVGP